MSETQIFLEASEPYCKLESTLPAQGRKGNRIERPATFGKNVIQTSETNQSNQNSNSLSNHTVYPVIYPEGHSASSLHQNTNKPASSYPVQTRENRTLVPKVAISKNSSKSLVFNLGRELTIYSDFVAQTTEEIEPKNEQTNQHTTQTAKPKNAPIYKSYREPNLPNSHALSETNMLAIGFAKGQIQLIDDINNPNIDTKINDNNVVENSRISHIQFLSSTVFIAVHASGNMVIYNLDENIRLDNDFSEKGNTVDDHENGEVTNSEKDTVEVSKSDKTDETLNKNSADKRASCEYVPEKSSKNISFFSYLIQANRIWIQNQIMPVGKILFQSPDKVLAVNDVSVGDNLIAFALSDGSVKILDKSPFLSCHKRCSNKPMSSHFNTIHEFHSYFGELTCVRLSNCERFCIAGGVDNRVSVYVLPLNCVLFRLAGGPRAWISSVQFDTTGSKLENCDQFLVYYTSLMSDSGEVDDENEENEKEPKKRKSSFRKQSLKRKRTISSNFSENLWLKKVVENKSENQTNLNEISGSAFSLRILAGSEDGRLSIWDIDQADFSTSIRQLTDSILSGSTRKTEQINVDISEIENLPPNDETTDHSLSTNQNSNNNNSNPSINIKKQKSTTSILSKISDISKEMYHTMKIKSTSQAKNGQNASQPVSILIEENLGKMCCPGLYEIQTINSISSTKVHAYSITDIYVDQDCILLATENRGLQFWQKS